MTIAPMGLPLLSGLAVLCAALSYLINWLMMPLYRRYALARPNARSSHSRPTPQGGGAGVLIAAAVGLLLAGIFSPEPALWSSGYGALAAGALLLATTGALDDMFNLPVYPRLGAQLIAAGLALYAVTQRESAVAAGAYWALAVPVLIIGLTWFVNLTNFMDGIDGITVAEFLPVFGTLALSAELGAIPFADGLVAGALLGSLAGFSPHNRHVARLFLGDVGSLPIGLICGALLLALALDGGLAAALILPMYYLADATITLVQRLMRGEQITQAHRSHFYQRATDAGWTVPAVTRTIWLLNGGLSGLALASVYFANAGLRILMVLVAVALVGLTLRAFSAPPRR